ncbi:MAG: NTP transferase domain-containing protein [Candidatus Cloacimonetes bacterium]|nr:NTP transferase domain-containing protein [Candidatus Cloacimonadota bacterium]
MKGIILAGGTGTRLYPLTRVTNKHLLPIGKEPMIYHSLKQLTSADITSILVVTSKEHMGDVVNLLGSGEEFGCDLTYKVQEKAGGIAQALALAENFAKGESIAVILGDNIFEYTIKPYKDNFLKQKDGARVLLKEVGDPERYGIAALDEYHVLSIEEKPNNPKTNFAVVGMYFYDNKVFSIIKNLKPSGRGELEITSVNNAYIKLNELKYDVVKGKWTDAGTFESINEANEILNNNNNEILT